MAVFSLGTTSRWRLVFLLAMLPAAGLLSLAQPAAVDAATITVNTTTDELNNDGDCSLREAIQAANTDAAVDACSAGSGADTINVPAGTYTLGISGPGEDANQTGDWDITSDVTILGSDEAATIIRGDGVAGGDRVLHIVSPGAKVEISNVTIQDGYQGIADNGGGILNAGALRLTDSTVRSNTGGLFGGGLHILSTGSADITNSTFSGNGAVFGGGIANQGSLYVKNSTIANNRAFGAISAGGGLYSDGKVPPLKNTILADNLIDLEGGPADCSGEVLSFGYNLIEDTTGCTIFGDTATSVIGVDPSLGLLQNNGGTTETHALLEGSAAIDAGSPDCPPPGTDQRGQPRFAPCDIGAFELAGVGGIAELPDVAGTPLDAPGWSGPSVGLLAGISAAITSGALALGAAAWYARRRWSR